MIDDARARAARLLARSPFAMPRAAAIQQIEERRQGLLGQPPPLTREPDFAAAEPMPIIDQPETFAADFWRARKLPRPEDEPPKAEPKRPKGRRPTELGPRHSKFEVFDGDGAVGGDVDNKT